MHGVQGGKQAPLRTSGAMAEGKKLLKPIRKLNLNNLSEYRTPPIGLFVESIIIPRAKRLELREQTY
jgi:hypothetical protein